MLMFSDTNEPFNIFHDIEKYHIWQEEFAESIMQKRMLILLPV